MKNYDYWRDFAKTGRIDDYLIVNQSIEIQVYFINIVNSSYLIG